MSNLPAISISDLKKVYEGNFEALKGVSLDIAQGDIFALLGPNGAGKSTLIGIITSIVQKTSGKVQVLDVDIDVNFSKAKSYVGVVPQEFNCNIFETVEQIIICQAGFYGLRYQDIKERLDYLLEVLSLIDKKHVQSRMLSGGMKRRLMIARALIHSPKILILDEPSAGVDIELRRSMWNFIQDINQREKTTIILTTHYLEEAEQLAKNIAIIDEGKILVNTNIKDFLKSSNEQTYVCELDKDVENGFSVAGLPTRKVDHNVIEVDMPNENNVNEIISAFDAQGILVHTIKPKEHRLESLFIRLVRKHL